MKAVPADYDLVTPGSLAAVLSLMASEPGQWTPMAGGTELMVQFGAGRLAARKFVDIYNLPELTTITVAEQTITLGAGVTYTHIRNSQALAERLPLLSRAASWTGSIANQNRGTLGGNLVNGSPAADSPPALLAYGTTLHLVSARGTRTLPYEDFHTGYKRNALAQDELLLAIEVHIPPPGSLQYLRKVGPRNAMAISKVALGATAQLESGLIRNPRIGLASVSHAPFRCLATEAALAGHAPGPELYDQAKAALLSEIAPLDDIRSTGRYRAQVAVNLVQEFLQQIAQAANS